MLMQKKPTKFGIGLVLGAIVGGIAAFFLSPKSGKENREMVAQKAKEFQKWLEEKEVKERVMKVWGEVTEESVSMYKKVTANLSKEMEALKGKVEKIDFEKYKALLMESIEKVKKDYKTTPKQLEKLSEHLKEEWKQFAEKKK